MDANIFGCYQFRRTVKKVFNEHIYNNVCKSKTFTVGQVLRTFPFMSCKIYRDYGFHPLGNAIFNQSNTMT